MRCVIIRVSVFFLFFAGAAQDLKGVVVGSDSVCSRQNQVTFPSADPDNEMNGFAIFDDGFILEDQSTTCTFDCLFPVSGIVDMNGGDLYLQKDFIFADAARLESFGGIFGNDHRFDLSEGMTFIPGSTTITLSHVSLVVRNNCLWEADTTIQGICTIDGNGRTIALNGNGDFSVDPGGQLTLKNLELSGVSASKLSCSDNTGSIILKNCVISLSGDMGFEYGSMLFERDVFISGDYQLTYSSVMASTIATQATLCIDKGTTLYYAPTTADRDLFYMTDESSCLYLDGCTLKSTETGIRMTKGRVFVDNAVTFSSEGTKTSELICFGDGTAAENDADITLLSGTFLTVYGGWHYDDVS